MGLRSWWKGWKAERAKRAAEAARVAHERAVARWAQDVDEARHRLEIAHEFEGFTRYDSPTEIPIVLDGDERVFLVVDGAGLVEARRGRGHYQGGSQGVSLRIAKGVSWRIGSHRGTFVRGEERPTMIDEGTAVVTSHRVVFQGEKQTREWAFSKLIGVDHDPGLTTIHVSNRQKASGILYGDEAQDEFVFRLDLAIARFTGDVELLVDRLKQQVRRLESARPSFETGSGQAGTEPNA